MACGTVEESLYGACVECALGLMQCTRRSIAAVSNDKEATARVAPPISCTKSDPAGVLLTLASAEWQGVRTSKQQRLEWAAGRARGRYRAAVHACEPMAQHTAAAAVLCEIGRPSVTHMWGGEGKVKYGVRNEREAPHCGGG
eukprot:CAMPEP_0196667592 /NCGR_PEP_ID=MMETSP1086-20130531/65168_1 /TAXON_ID=77921 /ORGANISM="Cyanoptyche  gloeocystis , Strain SAG4.97" /LENGTH=141 /DNA_ID=CAMNT_0042004937 /DNA_START=664 /DNA_END=1086 /DNA_ORIENTATION=+